jgi:hypothetical protein
MQIIIYLIKEIKMVESAKLNKHEKLLENDIVEYMELFIKSKDCIELLTKANNDYMNQGDNDADEVQEAGLSYLLFESGNVQHLADAEGCHR